LLRTSLTKPHHFDHKRLPHTGKIFPHPLVPLHRYNSPLYGGVLHNSDCSQTARSRAKQQTLIARPHLAGDVPGEHVGLIRPSSSRQKTAIQGVAGRAIREFGTGPGCAFWLMRGGPWVVGVHCYSAVTLHLEYIRGQGPGSYRMLNQELWAVLSQMGE